MEKNLPSAPSSQFIKAQCGAKVWQRGCELVSSRDLSALVCAGDELFGRFAGSEREPYRLHARLQNGEVAHASCSCPFDGGGWCKHLVALTLRYAAAPQDFNALPAVSEIIGALEREPLNALVESWVRRSPELLSALALSRNADDTDDTGAGGELRAVLRGALSGHGADEGQTALDMAVKRATQREDARDFAGASEVWRVLLEEIIRAVPHFEEIIEDEDEYGGWHREYEETDTGESWAELAVAGLNRCVGEEIAPELRETILRALWKAWTDAEKFDYFALPEETLDAVFNEAGPQLWSEVEADLMEQLQSNRINDYQRDDLLQSLIYGLQQRGQGAREQSLLREYGSYRQKLALLMAEKNYAAAETLALQNASSHAPGLLDVATDFDKAGQSERALRLVQRAQNFRPNFPAPDATQWLTNFYIRQKQTDDAQREAAALFSQRPNQASLELWKAAVALDGDWDDWDNRYPRLEKLPAMTAPLRVKLAMLDGRAARALELWGELSPREQAPFQEELARVCETDLPARAIELYRQMGENSIAQRGYGDARPLYRAAAGFWKRAREVHKNVGTLDEWVSYIRAQREANKRLPALQDELNKAGL